MQDDWEVSLVIVSITINDSSTYPHLPLTSNFPKFNIIGISRYKRTHFIQWYINSKNHECKFTCKREPYLTFESLMQRIDSLHSKTIVDCNCLSWYAFLLDRSYLVETYYSFRFKYIKETFYKSVGQSWAIICNLLYFLIIHISKRYLTNSTGLSFNKFMAAFSLKEDISYDLLASA